MKDNIPALRIENLTFRYEDQNVLEDINLIVTKGAFLGLVGPNGSGKTTLLKSILGLLKVQKGTIELFGVPIQKFKEWQKIGFVSQKANSFNSGFPATVFEVVSSGLTSKIGLFKFLNRSYKNKVEEAVASVGMGDFLNRNIGELSGGQQQRVFIARALVSEPEIMILDEPTVGVDTQTVQTFYNMLEDINKRLGITLILVTHDVGTITEKVSHVACLNKQLHFHGSATEFDHVKDNGLSQFYGHDLQLITHDHSNGR
ncbi:metal ABC transporter ATP-binding protein [Ferdinandcohnia quinoae]|uniref:ABC transporter ATP-binding protein n=1 Tax=Fredinandcohnia quinoae TaxID=2918902 RepID=A0AAW5E4Y5_9BACI|nr:ABC transporter ATP-binding protein [Fredinandcohnia sp. SECRCQ15]MCH1624952.1 ABC transporter ATP-binding protein [Fredinandcohnia sp. SECRCQ15]